MSRASVESHLKNLRAEFNAAVDQDLIVKSPARKVAVPEGLSVAERMLPAANVLRSSVKPTTAKTWPFLYELTIHLALATGLRRGELVGLQWGDFVRAEDGTATLTVRRQYRSATRHEREELGWPKAIVEHLKGRNVRSLTVDARTMAILEAHQIDIELRAIAAGMTPEDATWPTRPDGWIISKNWAAPVHPTRPTTYWSRIRSYVGGPLAGVRLHDLRHSHATELIAAGIGVRDVADRLGHDPTMTMGVYAHATPAGDQRAATTIEGLMYDD